MKEKITGFNTASGKCCCNLTPAKVADHVIKVSIPQAVSAVATVKFNKGVSEEGIVSIPQAVSAVATGWCRVNGKKYLFYVSIPQAVSAVATQHLSLLHYSGQICVSIPQAVSAVATYFICSLQEVLRYVSIPQAVSAVATGRQADTVKDVGSFNTASGKCCCNGYTLVGREIVGYRFQYRKR